MGFLIFVVVIIVILLLAGVKVINQYQKGVVFRVGKVRDTVKQPGLRFIIPIIDRLSKVI